MPKTQVASQYPGLFLFTNTARMMRPVKNLAFDMVEMIGTFEQVYLNICIIAEESHKGVSAYIFMLCISQTTCIVDCIVDLLN